MKLWAKRKRPLRAGQQAAAGLMLFLWLALFALAASPQLHHLLHRDSHEAGHQCLVTQIQHQPLLAGLSQFLVPAPKSFEFGPGAFAEAQFRPASDYRISSCRAPPES